MVCRVVVAMLLICGVMSSATSSSADMYVDTAWARIWARDVGVEVTPVSMAIDAHGNIYVCANSATGLAGADITLIKYSRSGELQFERTYSLDEAVTTTGMALHESCGLYVTGTAMSAATGTDAFVMRCDLNGDSLWTRRIDSPWHLDDAGLYVNTYQDGRAIIVGTCTGTYITHPEGQLAHNVGVLTAVVSPDGSVAAHALPHSWSGGDQPIGLALDEEGNAYIAGTRTGGCGNESFCPITSVFVMKLGEWSREFSLNSGGNINWAHTARALALDVDGSCLVAATVTRSSQATDDCYVIRYSSRGDLSFARRINLSTDNDRPWAIAAHPCGKAIVAGDARQPSSYRDYAVAMVDASGSEWVRYHNGAGNRDDVATRLCVDPSGNICVTGACRCSVNDMGIGTLMYDASGNTIWERQFDGPLGQAEYPTAMQIDPAGDVCVLGKYGEALVVLKYEQPKCLDVDILPGACPNELSRGSGELEYHGIRPGTASASPDWLPVAVLGTEVVDVSRIDPTTLQVGSFVPLAHRWFDVARPAAAPEYDCECPPAGTDGIPDLVLYLDRQEVIAALGGIANGERHALQMTAQTRSGVAVWGSDCLTLRDGPVTLFPVAEVEGGATVSLSAYPNPSNAAVTFTYMIPDAERVRLDIYNVLGQHMETLADAILPAGLQTTTWDARGFASGLYFIRLATSKGTEFRKVLLVK